MFTFERYDKAIHPFQSTIKTISNINYQDDATFMETLAALLCDRAEDKIYCINHCPVTMSATEAVINNVIGRMRNDCTNIAVVRVDRSVIGMNSLSDIPLPEGFSELKDFELFLKQKNCDTRLFTGEQERAAIIVMERPTPIQWHYIQAAIPRLLPWYFRDKPLNAEEKMLLDTPSKSDGWILYHEYLDVLAKQKNLKQLRIAKLLTNFAKAMREKELAAARNDLTEKRARLEDLQRQYQETLKEINEAIIRVHGLEWVVNDAKANNELVEIFSNNENLFLDTVTDMGTIKFFVITKLTNFDPDMFTNSEYFRDITARCASFWSDWNKRFKFLKFILSDDPLLKVRLAAKFMVRTRGEVDVANCSDFAVAHNCIPNAHLEYYACLGDNATYIDQCIVRGDWMMAIVQCISAAGTQVLLESSTASRFFQDLFMTTCKVIELPDGRNVTTQEAWSWLIENHHIEEGNA